RLPLVRVTLPVPVVIQDVDKIGVATPEHQPSRERRIGGADGGRAGGDGAAEFLLVPDLSQRRQYGMLTGSRSGRGRGKRRGCQPDHGGWRYLAGCGG